jgi:hypothetical protein
VEIPAEGFSVRNSAKAWSQSHGKFPGFNAGIQSRKENVGVITPIDALEKWFLPRHTYTTAIMECLECHGTFFLSRYGADRFQHFCPMLIQRADSEEQASSSSSSSSQPTNEYFRTPVQDDPAIRAYCEAIEKGEAVEEPKMVYAEGLRESSERMKLITTSPLPAVTIQEAAMNDISDDTFAGTQLQAFPLTEMLDDKFVKQLSAKLAEEKVTKEDTAAFWEAIESEIIVYCTDPAVKKGKMNPQVVAALEYSLKQIEEAPVRNAIRDALRAIFKRRVVVKPVAAVAGTVHAAGQADAEAE